MSDDFVESLRDSPGLGYEAAKEIERLRDLLDRTTSEALRCRTKLINLLKVLEEEREYWAGLIASAILINDPEEDVGSYQEHLDRLNAVRAAP